MSRHRSFLSSASLVALSAAVFSASGAQAQTFTINNGQTLGAQILNGTQTGTVESGGTLRTTGSTVGITLNNTATNVIITNRGLIEQTGNGRAIDISGGTVTPRSYTFVNEAGGIIRATAATATGTQNNNDAIRLNLAITGSTISLDNAGTIQSGGTGFAARGQAIDWRGITATSGNTITITNRATGVIEALADDALRPAAASTINNSGIIRSFGANTSGGANGTADGIDAGGNTGVVVNNIAGGLITGARHGITADTNITVVNNAGATIIGRNGSGVGSDGNGTVTNYGTITGAYAGVGNIFNSDGTASINGDGDGVDIDLIGTVRNFGTIQGLGAGGVDSGGRTNGSDGIAMGGGTIENAAGALISGATRGILIDDGAGGTAYGAITITNAGTIQGLAASAITIVGNFNNTITNSGTISGAGTEPAVFFNGNGANTLNNTGTITTSGTAPAVRFGDGNNTMTTSGTISTAGAVAIQFGNGNNALTISGGSISGNVIAGTGTNTLSFQLGQSGSFTVGSTYSGFRTVDVQSGALTVNGSLGASTGVTVFSGASLGGTGTIAGNIVVNSGGTLAPGNGVGTLQVNGNMTLSAGSTTVIEVQGATIDRINVTGTATLGGTVRFVPTGGTYTFNSPYTFIRAGTLNGTFAASQFASSFGPGITPTVSYTGTEAQLTLAPAALSTIISQLPGVSTNQRAVAGALDALVGSGQNVSGLFSLYNQSSAQGIVNALNVVSGQVGSTSTTMTVDASSQFLGAVLDPNSRGPDSGTGPLAAAGAQTIEMADAPGRAPRVAPTEPRTTLWAKAFGGFGSFRADAGIGTFAQSNSNLGIAVGGDYRISRDLVVGLAMGGSSGWAANANGLGRASADTFQIGVYGAAKLGQLQLSAATSYALTDVTTIRQIPFAGVGDITGRLKANAFSGRIEAGWRMDDVGLRGFALTPFAAIQSQWVFSPRYTESTPNAALAPFALTYSARTNATVRTELGLRTDYAVTKDVALFARAGWAAYLVRDTAITAGFASLPGTNFTATGGRPGPHAALGSLGVDWRMTPMTTLTARVDGEISDRHAVANGSVRMQVRF